MRIGSNCTVCSAASTGLRLVSGTFARPPPLGPNWKDIWEQRKIEVKGWVTEWSTGQITGLNDDEVKDVLGQLEDLTTEDAKNMCRLDPLKRKPSPVVEVNHGHENRNGDKSPAGVIYVRSQTSFLWEEPSKT